LKGVPATKKIAAQKNIGKYLWIRGGENLTPLAIAKCLKSFSNLHATDRPLRENFFSRPTEKRKAPALQRLSLVVGGGSLD
jgi:hypothetical protein